MSATHARLNDPSCGRIEVPLERFEEDFTGIVLTLRPAADLPERPRRPVRRWFLKSVIGLPGAGLGAMAMIAAPAGAGAMIAVADALAGGDFSGAMAGAGVLLGLRAGQGLALAALRHRIARRMGPQLLRHLADLPGEFFAYRLPSRLVETVWSAETLARLLCGEILPRMLDFLMVPVLIAAIGRQAPLSALALLFLTVAFAALLTLLSRWKSGAARLERQRSGKEYESLIDDVIRIETTKIGTNARDVFVEKAGMAAADTLNRQRGAMAALAFDAGARLMPIMAPIAALPAMADGSAAALAVAMLSLGVGALLARGAELRGCFDELRQGLFFADDILSVAACPAVPSRHRCPRPGPAIRLEGVVYGHSPHRPPLLDGVGLEVAVGEQIGIGGPSGGGKSTLARIIAGLLRPWSGIAEIEGAAAAEARPGWVDKEPVVFQGSVRDNLCLWQDFTDEALWRALGDACLDEVITARESGLDAEVEHLGRNFSGGQLQRMEIARALLRDPSVLVLDEAMDALDPALERRIRGNLKRRGCTVVIVSARASTLAGCDRVLHLDDGRFATPVSPKETERRPALPHFGAPVDESAPPPLAPGMAQAFGEIAQFFGIRTPVPTANVEDMARACGLYVREVRFVPADLWRFDTGPLLAFLRQDGRPVAILPEPAGCRLVDPAAGTRRALGAIPGGLVERTAYQVYPVLDLGDSPAAHLRFGWSAVQPELGRMAAACVLGACLMLLVPEVFRAGLPLSDVIAPLSAALGAAALAEAARGLASVRFDGRLRSAVFLALVQRIVRIDVGALRLLPLSDVVRAIQSVPRMVDHLTAASVSALIAGLAAVVAGLAYLAATAPILLFPGAVAVAAVVALPLALGWLAAQAESRQAPTRLQARRFLSTALHGLWRLRSSAAVEGACSRWERLDRADKKLAGALWGREAQLRMMAAALPWTALSAGWALAPAAPPFSALALWLIAAAGANLGEALGRLMRLRWHWAAAASFLAVPGEAMGAPPSGHPADIHLQGVDYGYGTGTTLVNVSLRLTAGEIVAVTGPSGSGKSTMLRLILGLDRPRNGRVLVGGTDMEEINRPDWRSQIGAVLQGDRVETAGTLRNQLGGSTPVAVAAIWRALEMVGMADEVRAMPMGLQTIADQIRLSTGQQQRLLIARQLVRAPRLLILDEATSAVPDALQAKIITAIRDAGITCLMVTHRESAITLAERVIVLADGRVVFAGSPQEALAREAMHAGLADERVEDD